jgi:flagellar hook-basal body complex protein FliE
LEVSKASVSLKAVSEVRNRLISAYQDIMNMQL